MSGYSPALRNVAVGATGPTVTSGGAHPAARDLYSTAAVPLTDPTFSQPFRVSTTDTFVSAPAMSPNLKLTRGAR